MDFNIGKTQRHTRTSRRRDAAVARITVALAILATAVSIFPDAYTISGGAAALSSFRGESATAGQGQESRPQDPVPPPTGSSTPKKPSDQSSERPSSGVFITSPNDYRIGPNDVIEVRVDKAPELSGMFRVNSAGSILMQHLGRVTVMGKSPDEVAQMLAGLLKGEYLKDPFVVVEVKQYNSRAFFVQGSVRNPGMYYIEGPPSLLKLIIIAGGLADNHGSTAFIIREIRPEEAAVEEEAQPVASTGGDDAVKAKYELIKRNINGLFKGAFDQDLIIEPGDVVNIPSTEVFFVAGEVHAPGSFPLREGTSLRQAISLAQGTTGNAALGRGLIFREDPVTGKRQEIAVDISDVMKGKKEDVPIMPNDTIIVPNSKLKEIRNTLLQGFGYGFVRVGRIPGRRF
jgi:polysaccharide export outer membrane protein